MRSYRGRLLFRTEPLEKELALESGGGYSLPANSSVAWPRLGERPAQRRSPEARRLRGDIGSYVDENVQPLGLLSQGVSEHRH